MTTPLTEPTVGAVYVFHDGGGITTDRYIILDATRSQFNREGSNRWWFLDLVNVRTQFLRRGYEYDHEAGSVTFEPLADGEEVLFFQAMIAPHTLRRNQ